MIVLELTTEDPSLCLHRGVPAPVVLLGDAGKSVPFTKQAFQQARKPKCEK